MNKQDSTTDPLSDQALPPWIKLHHGHVFHALPYGTLKRDPDAFLAYWLLVEANILTGPIYGSVTVAAELLGVRQETLERVIRVGAAISAEGMVQVSWAVMARNGGLKLRRTKQSNRKGNVDDRSTIVERSSHDRSTVASSLLLSEKSSKSKREEKAVERQEAKKAKKKAEHVQVVEVFTQAWAFYRHGMPKEAVHGWTFEAPNGIPPAQRYAPQAKDWVAAATLWEVCPDIPVIRRRMCNMFESTATWVVDNASIALLASKWNQFDRKIVKDEVGA